MRKEYDIDKLNPRTNPYAKSLRKPVSIKMPTIVIEYFKTEADRTGIPYQTLISMYLTDCRQKQRKINLNWDEPA